jgi:molybdopterin molybdotransferase
VILPSIGMLQRIPGFPDQIRDINSGERVSALDGEQIAGGERLQYLARAHRGQGTFQASKINRFLQSADPLFNNAATLDIERGGRQVREMMGPSTFVQVITRLIPLPEALAAFDDIEPVAGCSISVADSPGHILAADIIAPKALPPRPRALYDGVALCAEATLDASTFAPVLLMDPIRIVTGATVPDGADALATVNAVQFRGDFAEIIAPATAGEGVLPVGGDCEAGAVLRRAGFRVRPSDAAVFTLAGITTISVRVPRLCIGYARESDILRTVADMLALELQLQKISTRVMLLEDAMRDQNVDAVIGIGGTGEGTNDGSIFALQNAGRTVFHGVGLTPGETTAFGFIGEMPVLLMPGRLDATLAVWRILGKLLIARLCGNDEVEMTTTATLTRKVTSTIGMAEFVPLRIEAGKAEPLAAKYLPLSVLTDANAWILVPPASEGYQTGTSVTVQPWR